jgi:hypothetical protein
MGAQVPSGSARERVLPFRVLFAAVVAVALSAGTLAPAHGAANEIPPDVRAAFSDDALEALQKSDESSVTVDQGDAPDFSTATSFGVPRQVSLWSTDLILGKPSDQPTTALNEWNLPRVEAVVRQQGRARRLQQRHRVGYGVAEARQRDDSGL